ncbi:hypothetical protein G6F65_018899 [Rhizopus arrhizus]|nr:hypothetical protein G6F65_018899 [Rhizopus arrhizus]
MFHSTVGATESRASLDPSHVAAFVEGAAQVRRHLATVVGAIAQAHAVDLPGRGTLGHHVDHAAGPALAVQHRRRPLQHFDAVQIIQAVVPRPVGTGRQLLQAVLVIGAAVAETADHGADHAHVARPRHLRLHARRVRQRSLEVPRGLHLDLFLCHDRHRTRRLDQRHVQLATGAGKRHIAVGRSHGHPMHRDRLQLRRARRRQA